MIPVASDLIDRIETDVSLRVRRMAVIMLTTEFADPRAVPVLKRLLAYETDRKLRRHAETGLQRLQTAGMVAP